MELIDVLGADLYNQVQDKLKGHENDIKLANLADGKYVSKAKYDADIQAKDTRITELADQVKEYDGVDIKKLQADVADWEKKYNADIEAERVASAVQLAIAKSGARSDKAVFGMLDLDKVTIDDDGNVKGLDDQIEALKKDDAFLFNDQPKKKEVDLGGKHQEGGKHEDDGPVSLADAVGDYYDKQKE